MVVRKLEDAIALSFMKLYYGIGVMPSELHAMEAAATKAHVPKAMVAGIGWRAAENAGPGSMSVILEAQARPRGQQSAVDANNDDIVAVRVLRELIFERSPLPGDLVIFMAALLGTDRQDHAFMLRFCRDVCAEPDSHLFTMIAKQLPLGRGCAGWSETKLDPAAQFALVEQCVDDIESGKPPSKYTSNPPVACDVCMSRFVLQGCLWLQKNALYRPLVTCRSAPPC